MGTDRRALAPRRAQLCTMAAGCRYGVRSFGYRVHRRRVAKQQRVRGGDPRRVRRPRTRAWIARAASVVRRHLTRPCMAIARARRGTGATETARRVSVEARTLRRPPLGLEYKWLVAIVFVCGMFIDIMDTTIVFVATPTLAREFNAAPSSIEWVVLGYLLSLAVWIPASGWIGDRFGTKKVFLFALAMFTLASALCGQAHSLSELVGFRVLQGIGGGMLTPVGTAMLFRAFPPVERAKASTVLLIPAVIAPATGPIIGGWLVTDVSWRWIFYVNLPIGVLGFLVGFFFLEEYTEGSAGPFDIPGFVLSGGG